MKKREKCLTEVFDTVCNQLGVCECYDFRVTLSV